VVHPVLRSQLGVYSGAMTIIVKMSRDSVKTAQVESALDVQLENTGIIILSILMSLIKVI